MKHYIYQLLLIGFICSQDSFDLTIRSVFGKTVIKIDDQQLITPTQIRLSSGKHSFAVKDKNINTQFYFFLDHDSEMIINKELQSYLYFYPGKSELGFLSSEVLKYQVVVDNYMEQFDFQTVLHGEIKIVELREPIVIKAENYEDNFISIKPVPFMVYHINPILSEKTHFRNKIVREEEEFRQTVETITKWTLAGVGAYTLYNSIKLNQDTQENHGLYRSALTPTDANYYYGRYESSFQARNLNFIISVTSSAILTYFLFYNKWSDLSEYYKKSEQVSVIANLNNKSTSLSLRVDF